jgi:hypothetical protein
MAMNGMRPGIILLREGTDTSQVRLIGRLLLLLEKKNLLGRKQSADAFDNQRMLSI